MGRSNRDIDRRHSIASRADFCANRIRQIQNQLNFENESHLNRSEKAKPTASAALKNWLFWFDLIRYGLQALAGRRATPETHHQARLAQTETDSRRGARSLDRISTGHGVSMGLAWAAWGRMGINLQDPRAAGASFKNLRFEWQPPPPPAKAQGTQGAGTWERMASSCLSASPISSALWCSLSLVRSNTNSASCQLLLHSQTSRRYA
jgi:hypothetical protein